MMERKEMKKGKETTKKEKEKEIMKKGKVTYILLISKLTDKK